MCVYIYILKRGYLRFTCNQVNDWSLNVEMTFQKYSDSRSSLRGRNWETITPSNPITLKPLLFLYQKGIINSEINLVLSSSRANTNYGNYTFYILYFRYEAVKGGGGVGKVRGGRR